MVYVGERGIGYDRNFCVYVRNFGVVLYNEIEEYCIIFNMVELVKEIFC